MEREIACRGAVRAAPARSRNRSDHGFLGPTAPQAWTSGLQPLSTASRNTAGSTAAPARSSTAGQPAN